MKNILFSLLCLSAGFLITTPALAHEPIVTIDYINGVAVLPGTTPISVPYLPYTIWFEGTVTHEGQGNLNHVALFAAINGEYIYGPESLKSHKGETTMYYRIPWEILAPDTYVITVSANHDMPEHTVNETCKAAPAIANAYLKESEGDKSVISSVAKETGKNGELWAKEKCEPGHEASVVSFVSESE